MARKGLTWDGRFGAHFSLITEAERAAPIFRLTAKAEWSSAPAARLGTQVRIQKRRKEKANGNFVEMQLVFPPTGSRNTSSKGAGQNLGARRGRALRSARHSNSSSPGVCNASEHRLSTGAPRGPSCPDTGAEHSGPALCSLAGARALLPEPHPS